MRDSMRTGVQWIRRQRTEEPFRCRLLITGLSRQKTIIDAAPEPGIWQPIHTNTTVYTNAALTNTIEFDDVGSLGQSRRFYRARTTQ